MADFNNGISVEILNLEQVIKATKELQDTGSSKALRKGLGKGGRFLVGKSKARLRASTQQKTGNLMKSYRVKVKNGNTGFLVGFARSTRFTSGGGNHAHLVDLGHEIVDNRKGRPVHTGKRTKPTFFHTDTRQDVPQAAKIASQGIVEMIDQFR